MSSSNPKPINSIPDDDKSTIELSSGSSFMDPPPPMEIASPSSHSECHETTSSSLGGLSATAGEGDGDGFRTPTDSAHRILEVRACPPAPRKPTVHLKMRSTKRKASLDDAMWMNRGGQIPLLIDVSDKVVESMFPPVIRAGLMCKIKKARTI